MKIGYFINFKWFPASTGAGIHASQLAQKFIEKGHTIHKIFYDYDIPMVQHYRRRELFKFLADIDLLYIRVHEGLKTDVYSLLKILKLFNLPVVWEINAPLSENLSLGQSAGEVNKLSRKRRFLAKFADAAITTCDELTEYAIQGLGIKKSFTIPLGSDPERFSPAKRNPGLLKGYEDYLKVVWAGSAQYTWQALDVICELAKQMYAIDKKVVFFIVGKKNNQDLSHLDHDNIKIIDRVVYDDVAPYIAACDVGLCLYNHQPNAKFYRSPLKLFDYMACGLPVISTRVGQINNIVRHKENGFLVDDNNIATIIEYIKFIKNNKEDAQKIGAAARKDIEKYYNWTRVADETEKIFYTLLPKYRQLQNKVSSYEKKLA